MVPAAALAVVLGARIDEEEILLRLERAGDGGEEARPAGAGVELHRRGEERQAAAGAGEKPRPLLVVQRARAGALGAFFAQDLERLGREALAPLVLGELERLLRRGHRGARRQVTLPALLQLLDALHGRRGRGARQQRRGREPKQKR